MDNNEVYMLLSIVEKAHAQGTSFMNIRNEAIARLNEINTELDPQAGQSAPVEPEPAVEPEKEPEDA